MTLVLSQGCDIDHHEVLGIAPRTDQAPPHHLGSPPVILVTPPHAGQAHWHHSRRHLHPLGHSEDGDIVEEVGFFIDMIIARMIPHPADRDIDIPLVGINLS